MRKRRFRQANYATEAEILSISSKAVREDLYVATDTNNAYWIDYDGNPQLIGTGSSSGSRSDCHYQCSSSVTTAFPDNAQYMTVDYDEQVYNDSATYHDIDVSTGLVKVKKTGYYKITVVGTARNTQTTTSESFTSNWVVEKKIASSGSFEELNGSKVSAYHKDDNDAIGTAGATIYTWLFKNDSVRTRARTETSFVQPQGDMVLYPAGCTLTIELVEADTGTPATVVITSDESEFTDATPFEIQIEFNKAVTGFVVGDITITNATLSNFTGSGTSYTAEVTPDLSGDISISIAENVTNEGNSASNVVSVTLESLPMSIVTAGKDSGGTWSDSDFSSQTDFLCSVNNADRSIVLDTIGSTGAAYGVNAYILSDLTTISSGKKYKLRFHRKQLINTDDPATDGFGTQPFKLIGFTFGFLINKTNTTATYGSYGHVIDGTSNMMFTAKMAKHTSKEGDSAINYWDNPNYGFQQDLGNALGADMLDGLIDLLIERVGGFWKASLYVNDTFILDITSTITDTEITTILPYFHLSCWTSFNQRAKEEISQIELIEI